MADAKKNNLAHFEEHREEAERMTKISELILRKRDFTVLARLNIRPTAYEPRHIICLLHSN